MNEINLKANLNEADKNEEYKSKIECPNFQFIEELNSSRLLNIGNNIICVFNSIDDILYLIYSALYSIKCYNLIDNHIINEIKYLDSYFFNIRHFLDKINKRDLIITQSASSIYLWNFNNLECLLILKEKIYYYENISCFLNDNNKIYIAKSNNKVNKKIIIFDLNGNKINEINNHSDEIYSIENYYDYKINKNYIITGNKGFVNAIDYNENKIYHKYSDDNNNNREHYNIIINYNKDIVKLIDFCIDGYIRIWNFHTNELLKKIIVCKNFRLFSICLWNKNTLFAGCSDCTIKQVDIEKEKIIINPQGYNHDPLTIKKIFHHKYGEYLIFCNDQRKIKIFKNS